MSELKSPTKERVLAAAAKCDTVRDVLKEMWPEAFEVECAFKVGDRVMTHGFGSGVVTNLRIIEPLYVVRADSDRCCRFFHTGSLTPLPDEPKFKVGDRVYVERAAWGVDTSGPGTIREVQNFSPEFFVSLGGGGCLWCHASDIRPLSDEPWEDVTAEARVESGFAGGFRVSVPRIGDTRILLDFRQFMRADDVALDADSGGTEFRILRSGRIERRRKK